MLEVVCHFVFFMLKSIYVFVNLPNMTDCLKCSYTKLSMKFIETVSFIQFLHNIFINKRASGSTVPLFYTQNNLFKIITMHHCTWTYSFYCFILTTIKMSLKNKSMNCTQDSKLKEKNVKPKLKNPQCNHFTSNKHVNAFFGITYNLVEVVTLYV